MAATQILVALCVVGSAVAAPQLSLGRSRSVGSSAGTNINENQVVTSVISSLTPSISRAVEEALAAVAAAERAAAERAAAEQAAAEQAAAEQAAAEQAAAAAAAAAEAERIEAQRRAAQAEAARQQQIAAAAAEKNSFDSQVSADLGPFVDPVYNFEYKVADDEEKTYISRNENRNGNELTGSYSFIDAAGALVTVDYTAGVNGYAETRTKEAGKVTMKAVPAWDGPLAGVDDIPEASGAVAVAKGSSSSRFGSSSGSRSSTAISSSSSSSRSQSDLIAQILAALTPQINSAVAAALA